MADTAALVVALSAQLTKFEKDMNDAVGIAARGAKRIEDTFAQANPFAGLGRALGALGIATGVEQAVEQIQKLIEATAKLGDQAEIVGLTTQQFQALRFAIVQTGGSVQSADSFMDRFATKVSEAGQGLGELAKVFRVNNTAIKDAEGNLLSTQTLLLKYADLVKNAATAQDKMNLAVLVGGRQAGPALVQTLQEGSEGLRKSALEAEKLGVVLDDNLIKRAQEINTQWQTLKLQLSTTFAELAVSMAQGFREAIEESGVNDFLKNIFDAIGLIPKIGSGKTRADEIAREGGEPLKVTVPGAATKLPDVGADEFAKLLEQQRRRRELLDAEAKTIGLTAGETEKLKTQILLERQARQQNIPLTDARKTAITAEAAAMGQAAKQLFEFRQRWQGLNDTAQFAGNQLIDVIEKATEKSQTFGQIMQGVLRTITRELLQAAITGQGAFAKILGTASDIPGGTGGLAGAILSAVPKFAGGGVSSGGLAMVGERGPELVNLSPGARVMPADATRRQGGGVTLAITNNVDATGADAAAIARLERGLAASNRSIEKRAVAAVASHGMRFG